MRKRQLKDVRKSAGIKVNYFYFWQKWLLYSSILFALISAIFAIDGNNALFRPYNNLLLSAFWKSELPDKIPAFLDFVRGPMGGTMTCCYIILAYIAAYPFKNKERWARNAIITGFGGWLLLDSATCFYYGLYFQVFIINAFSVMVKALPLAFTWHEFNNNNNSKLNTSDFPFLEN
jgi:hypothetical protein